MLKVRASATLNPPTTDGKRSSVSDAQRSIERWHRSGLVQYPFESDVHIKFLERVDTLLKSLGNREVPRLYDISTVRTRSGLTYDQQIVHFLVDKVVITFEVSFIDVQARRDPEKTLYLMGTLNMLVGIQVMNWLEWIKLFIFHFVPSNPPSSSLTLDTPGPTLKVMQAANHADRVSSRHAAPWKSTTFSARRPIRMGQTLQRVRTYCPT